MPFDALPERYVPLHDPHATAVLEAARHFISQPDGWCQGAMDMPDGSHCVVGWVNDVVFSPVKTAIHRLIATSIADRVVQRLYVSLPKAARRPDVGRIDAITCYNDTHTKRSVLRLLDKAIAGV